MGRRLLPSTPWRYCRSTRPKPWETCTRVCHDLAVLHELRAATDLALRATKVTAQSLGRAMSTLVVQERHLWLCLADMKEQEKVQFLNAPVSQTGRCRELAQQFSAAQKQTEAFRTSCAGGNLLLPPRLQPSACSSPWAPPAAAFAPTAAAAFHQAASWSRSQAGRPARPGPRQTWRQAQVQEALRRATQRGRRLLIGRWWLHLSLPRRRAGWSILFFVPPLAPEAQRYPKSSFKSGFLSLWGPERGRVASLCITGSLPSSSLARQQVVAQEQPLRPFVEPGKGVSTPVPRFIKSSQRRAVTASSRVPVFSSSTRGGNQGECLPTHPDPAPAVTGQAVTGPGPCPCVPPRCTPTAGSVCGPLVPLAWGPRAWLALPRSISVAPADHQTRLRDSVRPASPQVQGCPLHFSESLFDALVLCAKSQSCWWKDAIEPVPSSRYEVGFYSPTSLCQEKRVGYDRSWICEFEPCTSQAAVQDDDAEDAFSGCVRSPRLVCKRLTWRTCAFMTQSYRTQCIPAFAFEGRACSVQDPAFGASQASWGFRSTGERAKLVPMQRISFFGNGVGCGQQTARLTQVRLSGAETASRLYQAGRRSHWNSIRGSWGIWLHLREVPPGLLHRDRFSTGSMAESPRWAWKRWYSPGSDYTGLPQTFSPWTDPSFLRAGVPLTGLQACCDVHDASAPAGWAPYNGHAVSGVWTGPQLRWHINCLEFAGSTPCLEPPQEGHLRGNYVLVRTDNTATVAYINRQGGLRCLLACPQLARHLLLWSQKQLRSLRAIHIQECQPGGWRAVLKWHFWGVETPSPGGPADWSWFGAAQVDLLHLRKPSTASGFYSLTKQRSHRCTGTQLAPGPGQVCVPPSEPTSTDMVQDQKGRGAGLVSGSILAPRDSPSLADSSEEGSAFSETGHPLAPASRLVETPCVVPGWDARF